MTVNVFGPHAGLQFARDTRRDPRADGRRSARPLKRVLELDGIVRLLLAVGFRDEHALRHTRSVQFRIVLAAVIFHMVGFCSLSSLIISFIALWHDQGNPKLSYRAWASSLGCLDDLKRKDRKSTHLNSSHS